MNPQVRTQPFPHAVDDQPATVIHVQVSQHDIGHGREVNAGGLESLDQPPGPRQVQVRVRPQASVDEDGPVAAAHHDDVQRPREHVRLLEVVHQPGRPDGRIGVVAQHLAWQREHPIADHQHVNLADLQRVARRNQLVEPRSTGV